MGVYQDKTTGGFYIEFQCYGDRRKKRLPGHITEEQALKYEHEWRATIAEEHIKKLVNPTAYAPPVENPEDAPQLPRKTLKGVLYILQAGDLFKIGLTRNLESRVSSLQIGSAHQLRVRLALRVANPELVESQLHRLYQSQRSHGEWFRLRDKDLEFLRCMYRARVVISR